MAEMGVSVGRMVAVGIGVFVGGKTILPNDDMTRAIPIKPTTQVIID